MAATVDPRPVAVARIGVGTAATMTAIEGHRQLSRVSEGRLAMPVFESLPAPTAGPLAVLLVVAVLAGLAVTAGIKTSLAAGVMAACQMAYFLWDQQTYSSHRLLIMLLAAYLVFARSDTAWSLHAHRTQVAAAVPYWPQLLMMSQISVLYLFAGLSKINGGFLRGGLLDAQVWWPLPMWLLIAMSVATVITEVFLAVALWLRRLRWLAATVGLLLHLSIVLMLREPIPLIAFALACVPLYPLFLSRDAPRSTVQRNVATAVGARIPSPPGVSGRV